MANRSRKIKLRSPVQLDHKVVSYTALAIGFIALLSVVVTYMYFQQQIGTLQAKVTQLSTQATLGNTTAGPVTGYNITGQLITPPMALADSPVIVQNQTFGKRLTGINSQLNASELAIINNGDNSLFEKAGEMYLNHTLTNAVGVTPKAVASFMLNGKPTVIYLGSTTCIFCGENRWAMALALSRFGRFNNLFKGYSAINDADVPTLYWAPVHYNSANTTTGDFFQSSSINFIAIEDSSPISGGFSLSPLSTILQRVNATGNIPYTDAMKFVIQLNNFQGTPYTIWGSKEAGGADAVAFGNSTPSSGTLPLTNMTHAQVLAQLAKGQSQFALTNYAGADLYIAMMCKSMNNTASVCSLPAIMKIEAQG